ncbi:hypothetical protein [Nocardioides flavescens]|uniref:Uncharacterized protein n=1 Tax=Nocardioides flavescens TaxID=2691959 RepID=A0A6L7EZI5_9ACTN|nr:hypothetical protein [Nocardioides flavescens]MXG89361.1 hypothetical protein [Nocardioides flavescens]
MSRTHTPLDRPRSTLRRGRRLAATAVATALVLTGAGCGLLDDGEGGDPAPAPSAATSAAPTFDSQFTRDGTFQSHIQLATAPGVDFVYTLYPTKSTPRTNEWYPSGGKYFSFTLQAYDLDRDLRDPFATKRKVYLSRIAVRSATTTSAGGATQSPYKLNAKAAKITFDPQPVTTAQGMLITSPKGAFELRNQEIGDVSADTVGLTLTFTAVVAIETKAGSGRFTKGKVVQDVPIAIFASESPTQAQSIPVNAN